MRQKILVMLGGLIIAVMVLAVSAPPVSHVQADNVLQDAPRLDGYHIYFTEAAREASRFDRSDAGISRFAGLLEMLGADLYTLEWRDGIPPDADLIVIPAPTSALSADQTAWLWAYLQEGGRLFVITDDASSLTPSASLFSLMWTDLGIQARDDVVVTEGEMRTIQLDPARSAEGEPTNTPPPPFDAPLLIEQFVTADLNTAHPITADLESLVFFGSRSLEIDEAPSESQVTSLVFSLPNYYGETDYKNYQKTGAVEYNIGDDTARAPLPVAAALHSTVVGMRIVVLGDVDFARNGGGLATSPAYSASFLYPDNARFLINAVAWLLDTPSAPLAFPTPGPTATATVTPTPTPVPEGDAAE